MVLNQMLKLAVEDALEETAEGRTGITGAREVRGGDINRCFQVDTDRGRMLLKVNDASRGSRFFQAEFEGLERLRATETVPVPRPLAHGATQTECFLVMEYIDKQPPAPEFWERFAGDLARLHRCTAPLCGLGQDNYIGTVVQRNTRRQSWGEFYAEYRLRPLVRRLVDEGMFPPDMVQRAELLFGHIAAVFPDEKPSLVHGDLWGGNFLAGPGGRAWVFDPAVYYGSREMDLAMARLFGGFDRTFFWHYQEEFPLAEGWQQRIGLCQLYPLLVHAVLFGGTYIRQAISVISEY